MSDCRFGVSPVNYPDPDPGKFSLCVDRVPATECSTKHHLFSGLSQRQEADTAVVHKKKKSPAPETLYTRALSSSSSTPKEGGTRKESVGGLRNVSHVVLYRPTGIGFSQPNGIG